MRQALTCIHDLVSTWHLEGRGSKDDVCSGHTPLSYPMQVAPQSTNSTVGHLRLSSVIRSSFKLTAANTNIG
jgi:hypothetical protein